jgi:hypothetical protein
MEIPKSALSICSNLSKSGRVRQLECRLGVCFQKGFEEFGPAVLFHSTDRFLARSIVGQSPIAIKRVVGGYRLIRDRTNSPRRCQGAHGPPSLALAHGVRLWYHWSTFWFVPDGNTPEFHEEWLRDEPCDATTTGRSNSGSRCQLSPGNGGHEIRKMLWSLFPSPFRLRNPNDLLTRFCGS